jgi:phenylalanyl-tRNA synthetase alpha chain
MQDSGWDELVAAEREFREAFAPARSSGDLAELERVRSAFFGPKGRLSLLLRSVGQLPPELRPTAGKEANRVKKGLEAELAEALAESEGRARQAELARDRLDMTLPGRRARPRAAAHPVRRVIAELTTIFERMGFEVATGPEVELDWYNFSALNFPPDHPARDMQDTFFVRPPDERAIGELLLRTHTSPVQSRSLERTGAPIRIISPGRVYRCDADATHSPMFHQIEGLWVDEGVSVAHMKGVLTSFLNSMFGERPVRLRPSFFPFVEPGAEADMACVQCDGAGCRLCKQTGWMEILGAGMVHPAVLEAAGVDPERYTGFAFGLGIDRIAMLRWHLDELGHLFRSDLRFLEQLA